MKEEEKKKYAFQYFDISVIKNTRLFKRQRIFRRAKERRGRAFAFTITILVCAIERKSYHCAKPTIACFHGALILARSHRYRGKSVSKKPPLQTSRKDERSFISLRRVKAIDVTYGYVYNPRGIYTLLKCTFVANLAMTYMTCVK